MKPVVLYPPDYRDETRVAEPLTSELRDWLNRENERVRLQEARRRRLWIAVWVVGAVVAAVVGIGIGTWAALP